MQEAKEVQQTVREIQIGKMFSPFDPNFVRKTSHYADYYENINYFSTDIILTINGIKTLLFIATPVSKMATSKGMNPFDFSLGHRITKEDFQQDTGLKKTSLEIDRESKKQTYSKEAPNFLFITNTCWLLNTLADITPNTQEDYRIRNIFPKEAKEFFLKLRAQVFFPTGSFESKPIEPYLKTGETNFVNFYPLDIRPPKNGSLREGLSILLPDNLEKLTQIEMCFVLAEEQPIRKPIENKS